MFGSLRHLSCCRHAVWNKQRPQHHTTAVVVVPTARALGAPETSLRLLQSQLILEWMRFNVIPLTGGQHDENMLNVYLFDGLIRGKEIP